MFTDVVCIVTFQTSGFADGWFRAQTVDMSHRMAYCQRDFCDTTFIGHQI